jgi:hypothetical protein
MRYGKEQARRKERRMTDPQEIANEQAIQLDDVAQPRDEYAEAIVELDALRDAEQHALNARGVLDTFPQAREHVEIMRVPLEKLAKAKDKAAKKVEDLMPAADRRRR